VARKVTKWNDDIYNVAAYSVTDAARYLRIPKVTLQSWLKGRSYSTKSGQQSFETLIQRPNSESPQLSFINLVEAHVLRIIRNTHHVKLDKIRKALDYMSQAFDVDHPLVIERFQTDGVDLFVEQIIEGQKTELINVARGGQLAMRQALKHFLTRVEWDREGIASRFFPVIELIPEPESDRVIFLDPSIRFGKPVIAGKGVPTDIIAELYNAGDSIHDIAEEYDCSPLQVTVAIQFESQDQVA
jgi:uncharacterized protein (DUF433 family)